MAKKQKKSKKNDGKKAAEAKNLAEAASKSAVVDDMEPLEATAANDAAALEAETAFLPSFFLDFFCFFAIQCPPVRRYRLFAF